MYADQLFVQAEIERRLELFGVADELHRTPSPPRRPSPLARLADRVRHAIRPAGVAVPTSGQTCHP